jgi:hypothetical protein
MVDNGANDSGNYYFAFFSGRVSAALYAGMLAV